MINNAVINKVCIYGVGGVGGHLGCKIASQINKSEEKNHESYFIPMETHLFYLRHNILKFGCNFYKIYSILKSKPFSNI